MQFRLCPSDLTVDKSWTNPYVYIWDNFCETITMVTITIDMSTLLNITMTQQAGLFHFLPYDRIFEIYKMFYEVYTG